MEAVAGHAGGAGGVSAGAARENWRFQARSLVKIHEKNGDNESWLM
jgi:hypothetical protein